VFVNNGLKEHRMCTVEHGEYFLTLDTLLEKTIAERFFSKDDVNTREDEENSGHSTDDGDEKDAHESMGSRNNLLFKELGGGIGVSPNFHSRFFH
jgi:hypothetical protein